MIGSGIEKWSEQFDCARGCPTIPFENGARVLADGSPALIVCQKLLKDTRQCGWRVRLRKRRELDECTRFKKSFDDGFEVEGVRASYYASADSRRLKNIVSTCWRDASADEDDAGERIDGAQLANRIEQDQVRR